MTVCCRSLSSMVKTGGSGSYSMCTAATASRSFVLVGVGEQQDGFFAVIHLAVGKAGLIGDDELNVIFAGNVGGGDDGELAPVDAAIEGDGANEGRGEWCCARWRRATCLRARCRRRSARGPAACPRLPCGGRRCQRCGFSQSCSWVGRSEAPYGLRHSIQRRGEALKASASTTRELRACAPARGRRCRSTRAMRIRRADD